MKTKFQNKFIDIFLRLFEHLPAKRRGQFWILVFGMFILGCVETVSAGTIAFFASFLSNPEKMMQSNYIVLITSFFKFEFLTRTTGMLLIISMAMVTMVAVRNLMQGLVTYFSGLYGAYSTSYIAEKLLCGFLYTPYEWHLSQKSADLIITLNWRQQLAIFLMASLKVLADALTIGILLISVFIVEPMITAIVVSVVTVIAYLIFRQLKRKLDRNATQVKNQRISLNRQSHRAMHGIKDAKIYSREKRFIRTFHKDVYGEARKIAIQQTLTQMPKWIMEVVGFLLLASAVCVLYIVFSASSTHATGTIALMAVVAWRTLPAISRILGSLSQMRINIPYIENTLDYSDQMRSSELEFERDRSDAESIQFNQAIAFHDVSFKYAGTHDFVLNKINIELLKTSSIGIVGVSGTGKSTLADLMIGLLKPTDGNITIDSHTIDARNMRSWRKMIGYVSQSPYIFDGSLAENIAFGLRKNEIDTNRVLECCRMAAIKEFVDTLPDGINTQIGERGVKVSGGQRQRVAIARALYNNPDVLIFDEATSSLDSKSEKAILNTIYSFKGKHTLIIIAHRLSTVEDCDEIVWLENGSVKQIGKPSEILPVYRDKMKNSDDKANQANIKTG